MRVTIRVEQIKVWAYIGVYEEEQKIGGYFLTDVEIQADLSEEKLLEDDLSSTYNYETVVKIVEGEMKESCALLENKAIRIARSIKKSDERIQKVTIKLSKLKPPFQTEVKASSVEISL